MEQEQYQEMMNSQGTRKQDAPPWETYAASFEEKLDPKLEDEIKRYSEHVHEKSSQQNEEELCRQKELTAEVVKDYRWLDPADYADEEARKGKVMHSSEFIKKLREECDLNCWYRDHPHQDKLTLLVQRKDKNAYPEVACWVQSGFTTEFTIMRFDERGVPLNEKYRGWRTCLMQILLKGFLSEAVIEKVFGKAIGPAAFKYNSLFYEARNKMVTAV
jgi:hypothetical protein